MSIKSWLGASIVTNVALIGLVSTYHWKSDGQAVTPAINGHPDPVPGKVEDSSNREKIIALAELEARARIANPLPKVQFWKSDADLQVEAYRSKLEAQQDEMRAALIARFGPAASEDPAFTRLFRPLDARFSYLSSSAQLAIAKLQRARAAGIAQTGLPSRTENPLAANPIDRDREFRLSVRAALSQDEFEAYQLRESRAARQLRASGIVTNEQEFRSAVQILEKTDLDPGPRAHLEGHLALSKLLGPSRFVRFSASRDPTFQSVRRAALAHRVQESQLLNVYDAIVSAQIRVLEAQSKVGADRSAAALAIREIMASRDSQIASVVGEQPAKEILKAYTNELMSMSRRKDVAAL
jgi:hypothetical protein